MIPLHIPDSLYVPELYIENQETITRSTKNIPEV